MSLCAQNMAIGVRAGMVYVLGKASNVEMTNVNRFHENKYLGGMRDVMAHSASISLHHIFLEGDGIPAVLPHH